MADEDVLKAVIGLAAHIQPQEGSQERPLSVVRVIYQRGTISPHTDRAPFDNPTSCVIEGRAKLAIHKNKTDLTVLSETVLYFGHDSKEPVEKYGVKIPSVHIGKNHHSAKLDDIYSAVWFSANFIDAPQKVT
jgi:hypothetical protein